MTLIQICVHDRMLLLAYLEIFDLVRGTSTTYPPAAVMGWWIHAIELYSVNSSDILYAVGENSGNGLFAVLSIDLRTKNKYVCIKGGCLTDYCLLLLLSPPSHFNHFFRIVDISTHTTQMLWPLRVHDNFVFANSVVSRWETGGTILQFDRRRMSPAAVNSVPSSFTSRENLNGTSMIRKTSSSDQGLAATFPCGTFRCEDFSCMHNHVSRKHMRECYVVVP